MRGDIEGAACTTRGVLLEPTTFGQRFRRLREARGLTQDEVAQQSGVNVHTIMRWEKDKTDSPKGDNLHAAAEVLGTSVRWLLTGTESASSSPQIDRARSYARAQRLEGPEAAFVEAVAGALERQRRMPDDSCFELIVLAYRHHTQQL